MPDEDSNDGVPRRTVLQAAAGVGSMSAMAAALGQTDGGTQSEVEVGEMALNDAHNVAGDLWIGPDAGLQDVSPETGRVYKASDTQVEYYADGSSWTKMGVGSSSEAVPSVTADQAVIAQELGLPEYDDVSNAPQTQGRLVYATGDGVSAEGIFRHDGSGYSRIGGGVLSDSGIDNTDGGDLYGLPNSADGVAVGETQLTGQTALKSLFGGVGGDEIWRLDRDSGLYADVGNGLSARINIQGTGTAELQIYTTGATEMHRAGSLVWSFHDDGAVSQSAQDLSQLTLTSTENGRIYRHDGANSINADGGTTSSPGYYAWDNSASEFKSIVKF